MFYHDPVLGSEVLHYLGPLQAGTLVDGTVGGGGHAALLLEACDACDLVGVDLDPDALAEAGKRLAAFGSRVRFVNARFDEALGVAGLTDGSLAGALLDLGVSSHQLDEDARGFTYRTASPLDMRMGPKGATAADFLRTATVETLAEVFGGLGELPRPRAIANEVVRRRQATGMESSDDLVAALARALDKSPTHGEKARAFQAVRIAVNDEMGALERALPRFRDALAPGAALVAISYHSLEDRRVKHAFREWSRSCVCPPRLPQCMCRGKALGDSLTKRPVQATPEEIERNPRARSAKLRAWRKAAA